MEADWVAKRSMLRHLITLHPTWTISELAKCLGHYERPHQGRACGNVPPCVAFPHLPPLPPVPAQVDPDLWVQSLHGRAFARRIRSNGTVSVDDVPYYVRQELAGQLINLLVDAPDKGFEVWHGAIRIKRLPIKGLYGKRLSFEEYVMLMRQEARSDGHRPLLTYHAVEQGSLWAEELQPTFLSWVPRRLRRGTALLCSQTPGNNAGWQSLLLVLAVVTGVPASHSPLSFHHSP